MPETPTTVRQILAENMRRLRQERQWSQEELARMTKLHHNQISAMERCKHSVGIDIVEQLARAFGVTPGTLLDPPAGTGPISES